MADSPPLYDTRTWQDHDWYVCRTDGCGYDTFDLAKMQAHLQTQAHLDGRHVPGAVVVADAPPPVTEDDPATPGAHVARPARRTR